MYKLFEKSVKDAYGLVIRQKNFLRIAEARGFPRNEGIKIVYKDNLRIGYIIYEENNREMICKEIAARNRNELKLIFQNLETETAPRYLIFKTSNPIYK